MSDLREYVASRDAMLQRESPAALIKFMTDRGLVPPSTLALAEITLHKTITAARSLPMQLRSKSKKWLKDRGFEPLDDGDVP